MVKSFEKLQCYCCNEIATTKEHIPPKCFFPKSKDLSSGNSNYRSHLMTVPSCFKHNNSRSKDDEYTAAIIAMNSNSNLAFTILQTKWMRTLLRRNRLLGKRIFSTAKKVKLFSSKNGLLIPCETLSIRYERDRINHVIESVARGLYYFESNFQKKWQGKCIIKSPNFHDCNTYCFQKQPNSKEAIQILPGISQFQESEFVKKGKHQDVFYYQFLYLNQKELIIKMVFYNDFEFFALLKND